MAHGKFEFKGTGLGYIWLFIWTSLLIIFTLGIFSPWAVVARQRWKCAHTYIDGKQLCFKGSGAGFFANWLLSYCSLNYYFRNIYPLGNSKTPKMDCTQHLFC